MKKCFELLLFFVFLSFTNHVFSQKSEGLVLRTYIKCSSQELDVNSKVLPKNYYGNDLYFIANELYKRKRITKDEFETTPQFLERRKKEKEKPLIGNLRSNNTFAFQIDKTNFRYNADEEVMNVELEVTPKLVWDVSCDTIGIINPPIGKFREFRTVKIFSLIDAISLDLSFNINIPKAKKTKPNLKTLLIGKKLKYSYSDSVSLELASIWIYDVKTGEVFIKKNVNLKEEEKKQREKRNRIKENEKKQKEEESRLTLQAARDFYKDGEYDEAMTFLNNVIVREPMSGEAYLIKGQIYLKQENFESAESNFKTALFWNNQLIDAHIGLITIYLRKGDCFQSKEYLASLLAIDKENQNARDLQSKVEKCAN